MNRPAPKVSVCIPTYRGAQTIGPAIASVLAQTFADFELIVIDDGSPDETAAVVAGFDDPRIRYLRNASNLGPEGNWNRCLELARGSYFKLLPHDDLLHPQCLERQVAVLDQDAVKRVALVVSARDVLTPEGRRVMSAPGPAAAGRPPRGSRKVAKPHFLESRGYPGASEGLISAAEVFRHCVRRGTNLLGETGAVMFRRSLAEVVGRFDAREPYVIDMDYWFRLLAHGHAHYCADPLAAFRLSGGQWSVALVGRQSSDFLRCIQRHVGIGTLKISWFDRLIGRFTLVLNNLARQAFYRLYLR